MPSPDRPASPGDDFNDDVDEEPKVDLTQKYFPRSSSLKSLVDRVYGKDFLSTTMAVALEKPEARDALVLESLEKIKQNLAEVNRLVDGPPKISLKELATLHKDLLDRIYAALGIVGTFIHQIVNFPEMSGVRCDEDFRYFVLGLGSNSGGERVFISLNRNTGKFESVLNFPGQDTSNCRTLQSGFRKLFPGQVKRRTRDGSVVEDPNETSVGDLFLEF
jgi:hypothetical protein